MAAGGTRRGVLEQVDDWRLGETRVLGASDVEVVEVEEGDRLDATVGGRLHERNVRHLERPATLCAEDPTGDQHRIR